MTYETLSALDTEKMSEEEARVTAIEILRDELTGEKRALRRLTVFMIVLILIAFGAALITGNAECLIIGLLLGILECCFELNYDGRKLRRIYKKALAAFENGTYEGSCVAFVRDFRAEAIRKHEELQKYMKKPKDVNRE